MVNHNAISISARLHNHQLGTMEIAMDRDDMPYVGKKVEIDGRTWTVTMIQLKVDITGTDQ